MTDYRVKVWYASTGEDDAPQVHDRLDVERARAGAGAFLRDLLDLGGAGVRRLTVEVTDHPMTARCDAVIFCGRGHQSSVRCDKLGPHVQHRSRARGEDYYWHGDEGVTGFFDESPEDEVSDEPVGRELGGTP